MGRSLTTKERQALTEMLAGACPKLAAAKGATAAESIAELREFFDSGRQLSPDELAAYRHRLSTYGRSGTPQSEMTLEPPSCA